MCARVYYTVSWYVYCRPTPDGASSNQELDRLAMSSSYDGSNESSPSVTYSLDSEDDKVEDQR